MDQTQQIPQGAPQGMPQGGQFQGAPPGGRMPGGRGAFMFFGPWGGIVAISLLIVTYVVLAISFWRFLKKAGLTPGIALLMLVPVVNLFVALWAAFTEWPVLRENERLKALVATPGFTQPGAPSVAATTAEAPTPGAPPVP